MSKKAAEHIIDITTNKRYVRGGPHLWVSKLLYQRGVISSQKIWEEYLRDGEVEKDLITSKSVLKQRILRQMVAQKKIVQGRAIDIPQYKHSGWKLVPHKAFKNVDPEILVQLNPMPQLNRQDYKEYLRKHGIPYDF